MLYFEYLRGIWNFQSTVTHVILVDIFSLLCKSYRTKSSCFSTRNDGAAAVCEHAMQDVTFDDLFASEQLLSVVRSIYWKYRIVRL